MSPTALDVSAAHPLYLYIVFATCVVAALALLVGATVSRRNSSWRRQMQLQQTATARRAEPAYPTDPAPAVADEAAEPELVTATAKKATPRKTAARKTTPAKKTTAAKKAAPAKKTASRTRQ